MSLEKKNLLQPQKTRALFRSPERVKVLGTGFKKKITSVNYVKFCQEQKNNRQLDYTQVRVGCN